MSSFNMFGHQSPIDLAPAAVCRSAATEYESAPPITGHLLIADPSPLSDSRVAGGSAAHAEPLASARQQPIAKPPTQWKLVRLISRIGCRRAAPPVMGRLRVITSSDI